MSGLDIRIAGMLNRVMSELLDRGSLDIAYDIPTRTAWCLSKHGTIRAALSVWSVIHEQPITFLEPAKLK